MRKKSAICENCGAFVPPASLSEERLCDECETEELDREIIADMDVPEVSYEEYF